MVKAFVFKLFYIGYNTAQQLFIMVLLN